MASSILHWFSEKAVAKLLRWMGPARHPKISSSPWLMLPPSIEGNNNNIMDFNFYDFSENTARKVTCERVGILAYDVDDIKFVSSCHGWLALFNKRNHDLFLFNPISGRQIKLPSIEPLLEIRVYSIEPSVELNGFHVTKVITSCSPEEQDCRVVISFGAFRRLAFCSPTSSNWTYSNARDPINAYDDFVYSSNHKRFYCLTASMYFEAWDLQDTKSPKFFDIPNAGRPYPVGGAQSEEQLALQWNCRDLVFLVVAEECGDLFWVRRYIMPHMDTDGSYVQPWDGIDRKLPYKTIGFDVYKYDLEKGGALVYMDGSLDGLALFIGNNHSFAVSASEFPELQPNSIYFTDEKRGIPDRSFGGHDIGIFNYENKRFSPTCYYPCDRQSIKRIMPPPMWFTPTY